MKEVRELAPGEFYHIYNRGVLKRKIFLDDRDRARFLFLLITLQSPVSLENIHRNVQYPMLNISSAIKEKIVGNRSVRLIAFSLMPNHFHLMVEEMRDGGISKYLQRLGNAYTKYFNIKHELSGYLFQGKFKFRHIKDNDQLIYTSAYIHRNCHELGSWKNKEEQYPWSSYQDYLKQNRWPELLVPQTILEQFQHPNEYQEWLNASTAKDLDPDENYFE